MSKRVVVTVELDNEFIHNLRVGCTLQRLGNLREDSKPQTATQTLGLAVLMEAMGAHDEQIHAEIPPEWRPHLRVLHEKREVIDA